MNKLARGAVWTAVALCAPVIFGSAASTASHGLATLGAGQKALPRSVPQAQTLYLLAGTPQEGGLEALPVNLYTVGQDRTLRLARVIVGLGRNSSDFSRGLYAVRDDQQGDLFVIWPMEVENGAHITVIHEDEPLTVYQAEYGGNAIFGGVSDLAAAAGPGGQTFLLIDVTAGSNRGEVTRILSRPLPNGGLIEGGKMSDYVQMRYSGEWIGATPSPPISASVVSQSVAIPPGNSAYPPLQTIGPVPPNLPRCDRAITTDTFGPNLVRVIPAYLEVAFATARYFAFCDAIGLTSDTGAPTEPADCATPSLQPRAKIWVLDRMTGKWQSLPTLGPWPPRGQVWIMLRIFGDWVAEPVMVPWPGKSEFEKGPVSDGERNLSRKSLWYPDVYDQYNGTFLCCRLPGQVTLRNLADGRVVTLTTGIRDTEILDIESDGTMLYRADDKIYQTKIAGSEIAPASLVAQGDDVPEVHWAFWSKQPPPAQPIGMENAIPHDGRR